MARAAWIVFGAGALQACVNLETGYHLPAGDPVRGRAAFAAAGCIACHRVEGIEELSAGGDVALGGDTSRVKTYGDLITAIVNPSHTVARARTVDGESPMAGAHLNELLTVQQLVDIAAFLQDEYEVIPPPVRAYSGEYPPLDPAPPSADRPVP